MPNSQDIDPVADPTLAKLLDIDADLAAQEAPLVAQLQEIEEKRRSLQTVLNLFTPKEVAAPADVPEAASLSVAGDEVQALEPLVSVAVADEAQTPELLVLEEPLPEAAPPEAAPPAKRHRATSKKTKGNKRGASKPAGARASWQSYVREEFPATAPLPELVASVLNRLPERVFSVPELMSAIFDEEISLEAYKTAQSRLLTLLSKGVKEQQWARSDRGQYRSAVGGAEMAVGGP